MLMIVFQLFFLNGGVGVWLKRRTQKSFKLNTTVFFQDFQP